MNDRIIKTAGLLAVALFCAAAVAPAQGDSTALTLERAIALGQAHSVASSERLHEMRAAYVQYRNYKANLLPNVSFDASLPQYNKSLRSYQNADGTYTYISNDNISESAGLSVSQMVPWTGGRLSLSTNLDRSDQLSGEKKGEFLTVPFSISYSQPLFAFNQIKWSRRIEPLRYQLSRVQYAEAVEEINTTTVGIYFDFLTAGVNREIAYRKRENANNLHHIALAKHKIGIISDIDVMQLQVGVLNANADVKKAEQNYNSRMNALKNYLGFGEEVVLVAVTPEEKPLDWIDIQEMLSKSFENNPMYESFKLRLKSAEMNLAKAKAELFPTVDLYLSAGQTGSHSKLLNSYSNLSNRQVIEVGLAIPILDWGRRKNTRRLAESQYELEKLKIEREEQDFTENIKEMIQAIADLPEQVKIYAEAAAITEKRYKIAFEKFALGTIGILDINAAEQEAENARRNYIDQIRMSWLYFYNIRYITLYDFEKDRNIEYDIDF